MVYWSHLSVQKRFNLESGFSTFLCSEFTIRRYALFLIIYAWIRLVPARRSRPVFLILGPKSLIPLTKRSFLSSFRSYLVAAGTSNAQNFIGHSFRRGATSWAFRCGVPGEIIQLYGDWSIDAYKLYLEFSLESKLALANQLRQAIIRE